MADRLRPPGIQTLSPEPSSKPTTLLTRLKQKYIYGTPHFAIIAGDAGMYLARKVGKALGKEIPNNLPSFANNELKVVVPLGVAATKDVYVIQSSNGQPDSALTQLRLLEEAAKGACANRIYAVVTHLPYSRQDRREQPGATEAARLFAREIARAGSHDPQKKFPWQHESKLRAPASLLFLDIHSRKPLDPIAANNHVPWVNLDPAFVIAPKVQEMIDKNHLDVVVAFPDTSAEEKYQPYVQQFGNGRQPAIIHKVRPVDKNNVVGISNTQEDTTDLVADRDVIMFDDMIDTGGSILQAAKRFREQGAKSVRVVATHGVFSKDALTKLMDPAIDHIVVTNSIQPTGAVLTHPKIQVVSVDPLIVETIKRIENRKPLAELAKSMSPGFERSYLKYRKRVNYYRRNHS